MRWRLVAVSLLFVVASSAGARGDEQLAREAADAQARAVRFFRERVAVEGGYVYQVTSDLKHREGEGDAGTSTVWVQPPGTPAVGQAYLDAYGRTPEPALLLGAREAAGCLLRGQLHSGGWQNRIDFDPKLREKTAYRIDGPPRKRARNWSSFDDDQTQSALRFLMRLDRTLSFEDAPIHDATLTGLRAVVANQFPNGAWAQGFEELDRSARYPDVRANYPAEWSRTPVGKEYWRHYTLNDQALVRVMETMWLAGEIYEDEPAFRRSAIRAADFLLKAQMPDPQPAWAQQYDYDMRPAWARKFEPPAVSGGESQTVVAALMEMATLTGERRFLEPVGRALDYLEGSRLPDGQLARFYELRTNRPLYFTKEYELTYDDGDLPTHYSFKVPSRLEELRTRYHQLKDLPPRALLEAGRAERQRLDGKVPSDQAVREVIASLDDRGAWVEPGRLRYARGVPAEQDLILSRTFIVNLERLSRYVAANRREKP